MLDCLLREAQLKEKHTTTHFFNGEYDFDMQPLITDTHVANRSFPTSIALKTSGSFLIPPPDVGKHVTLTTLLDVGTEFTGQIVPTPSTS